MLQIDRSQNISQREIHRPSFVTFTGVDERTSIAALQGLSGRYPIEWGVLLHPHPPGPLFPNADTIEKLRGAGLRLSAHVCDNFARDIAAGEKPRLNLAGFSRVQVNHGRNGATEEVIANVQAYAASQGLRAALQCSGAFPADGRVDWLYDVSFGEGVKPSAFPVLSQSFPLCGFAGGLGPDNVREVLSEQLAVATGVPFWIDMESGVRTGAYLEVDKCQAVCVEVFG